MSKAKPDYRRKGTAPMESEILKDQTMPDGIVKRRVDQVKEGDLVDLEGDQYADPTGDLVDAIYEYARVQGTERETPNCIVLHTSQGSFGFPADHWLDIADEATA